MYFIRFINTPRSDPRILVRGGLFRINISILQHALTRISSYSPIIHMILPRTCRAVARNSRLTSRHRALTSTGKFPIDICSAT